MIKLAAAFTVLVFAIIVFAILRDAIINLFWRIVFFKHDFQNTEIRILTKELFIDTETGERFYVWRGAYGVRLWLASLIFKL